MTDKENIPAQALIRALNAKLREEIAREIEDLPQADLLNQVLVARDAHIRAAATRVLSAWASPGVQPTPALSADDTLARLSQLVADENPRVRLEAVRAASFFRGTDTIKALEIAEEKEAVANFGSSDSGASLGDILGAALKDREKK